MNALVKSQGRSIGFIVFYLCLQLGAAAQLKANFTVTSLSGCSPLIVYFSDQSAGSPTSWRWDLGNGVISTLKNPSVTYFNPGNYTIKLTVKNGSGSDSIVKEQYITVYANPVVDFNSPDTVGCFPKTIQFTDKSFAASGSISKWEWDFGDGTISADQHPFHTYTSAGSFNVSLKVTNSFGCTKTVTQTQYVKINEGAKAFFNINSAGLCTAPAAVQFNNTSTGSVASYVWNFGDGNTSSAINPSHTYGTNGNYSVTLVAISTQGCRDTLRKENALNIGTNRSDFSIPSLICEGQPLRFINTSSPLPSSARWNFGDGSFSDSIHPIKTFTAGGSYTVKLVNDFGSCKDSMSKQITVVGKPKANLDAGTKLFCTTPANVQFQSASMNAASYFWIFGDGTTSVAANPIHTYNSFGNFSVTLIVTNASGCSDTIIKKDFIQIQKPQIELRELPKSGCAPLTVNPTANIVSNRTIVSYLWKFGDGTSSTSATPQHIYTTAGVYNITLVITTQGGCKDSVTMISAVKVGNKPHAQFTASPGEVCNADPAHFTDNSTGDVDEWHWDFGDHLSSTDQNPSHVFNGLGQFTVSLIAFSNGCADTVTIKDAVNVLPPVSLFIIQQNCTDKYKVDFTDQSIGATRVEWDFGDGTTSTLRNPSHRFATPGVYKVGLNTFNSTCSNYNYSMVKIVDEKAKIIVDKNTICKGSTINFSCPSVIDSNIVSWRWDIGDGVYSGSKFSHTYSNTGSYKIVLTITDVNGCISSDTTEVKVYGPKADFAVSAPSACLKENAISFTNASSTDGTHPIVKSIWNFGDEHLDSTNSSPVHQYQKAGNYTISLLVKDSYGCADELIKNAAVVIAQPVAGFYSLDTMSCVEKNIAFINSSSAVNAEYQWSFGDGITSTSSDPIHTFSATGLYTVKLSVTDQYGCKDSVTKKDYINISLPKAKFIVSDSVGNCPPLIINFTNQSSSFVDIKWDFGDGNISTLANPVHYYNLAGTFYAKLIATGPGGCTDTAIQKIVVKGPSGTFNYTPIAGCNPLTASFNASTRNTTSFVWDFSDGNTISGNGSSITHEYTNAGEYIPKIILTDAAGCNVPIVGPDTIHVYQVTADFNSNMNSLCKAGFVKFTNKTISNDLITNYQWDFGDGSINNETNPSHFYKAAGSYTVKLTAFTQDGCTSTITLSHPITVLPAPSIDIESVNEACAGTQIGFNAIINEGNASELKWQWNLGNGKTASTQSALSQLYANAGDVTISAVATALNGCTDTATKQLSIHPLPLTNAGSDEWICLGSTTQLHATGAETYKWDATNSPSCISCANPTAAPGKTSAYVVTGYNQFGCSSKDSVLISVQQPFILKVGAGDTICIGEPVRLSATGADVYSWYPSTGMQNSNIANTIAVPQTSTTYRVVGKDNHNCFADTAEVFIKVWPIPTVSAGADQTLVVGSSLQLKTNSSNDVNSWQWFGGGALSCSTCSTTLVSPKQTTTYKVVVKNDGGCSASDEITVNVICNNGNLFVPNTFSPNGDGMNDKFYPSGTGINRIKSLRVFNRWGEIVFEKVNFSANDASSGWDGKYKGELLAPDVYIWSCEVICENNEVLLFKGDVTLLR
jgi:gliding motility-associated-like protein